MTLWLDGDSCHRKAMEFCLKAGKSSEVSVHAVADRPLPGADGEGSRLTVLEHGSGSVDDFIVNHASRGDITVTRDLELAGRLLAGGVRVLNDQGRIWDERSLSRRLEEASLMNAMKAGGMVRRRKSSYDEGDASAFADALEKLIYGS